MTTMRQAWRIPRAGSLARLQLASESLAAPGPGEVRIRVEAVGLNFADIFACLGLYSATPSGSFVPGLECAGVIESIGPAAGEPSSWQPGDRVMALTRFGAYATQLNVATKLLHRVPEGWSAVQAAAYPVQGLTAWYGLVELGRVTQGETVLVQSAAGGVGLLALEMLRTLGAQTIAVVGNEAKRNFLVQHRGLDPARVILRRPRTFARDLDVALAHVGSEGLDCVLDAVLGPAFTPSLARLRPAGRYVLYGAADFMGQHAQPNYAALAWRWLRRPRLDPLAMISANQSLLAFNLIWLWDQAARLPGAYAALGRLLGGPPGPIEEFPFAQAPEAMRRLQSGQSIGKLVLRIEP